MYFFDRDGIQIPRKTWEKLIRDPDYCNIWITENFAFRLATSWLGVQMECEETNRPFIVTHRLLAADTKPRPSGFLRPMWFKTAAQACAFHDARMQEIDHKGPWNLVMLGEGMPMPA